MNIASLDRPEDGIKSLPRIAAESIGRDIAEIYTDADKGVLEDVQMLRQVCDRGGVSFVCACDEAFFLFVPPWFLGKPSSLC